MLADFEGTKVPAVLVLNMMDVAKGQGISIDTDAWITGGSVCWLSL